MNEVKVNSRWAYKQSPKREVYTVLSSDYEGVVATTAVKLNTNEPDSNIWFSPLEDFLESFTPLPTPT
jgi:hypothetical protein